MHLLAIDLSAEKLEFAKELGVHHTVNAADKDAIEQVHKITDGGVHIAVETAGSGRALQTAYEITRRGGTTVAAGMPGPEAEINLSHLKIAAEERCLRGSYMGSCVAKRDIPRYLNMFKADQYFDTATGLDFYYFGIVVKRIYAVMTNWILIWCALVRLNAKLFILDTLGCALGGRTQAKEEVSWITMFTDTQNSKGSSTIFGEKEKTSAAIAALANGAIAHTIDFDDTHMPSISHLGSSLVATTFAIGEELNSSGEEIIEAFVLGFDVAGRVGRCAMPSHYKYWHPTATFGGR